MNSELKRIWTVCKFECLTQLKKKSFWTQLIITAVILMLITASPVIGSVFKNISDWTEGKKPLTDSKKLAYCYMNPEQIIQLKETHPDSFTPANIAMVNPGAAANIAPSDMAGIDIKKMANELQAAEERKLALLKKYEIQPLALKDDKLVAYPPFDGAIKVPNVEELEKALEEAKYNLGVALSTDGTIAVFFNTDKVKSVVKPNDVLKALDNYQRDGMMAKHEIDTELVSAINSFSTPAVQISLGKNGLPGYTIAFIVGILIYQIIIMFGGSVSTAVAREKNDRTMELLITNTTISSLINGKVWANIFLSIFQIAIYCLGGGLVYLFVKDSYPQMLLEYLTAYIHVDVVAIILFFAILGEILYFYLFAAAGALANQLEDAQKTITPIMMIFMLAYFAMIYGNMNPYGGIMVFSSIFPLTSILCMTPRYLQTAVPIWQMGLSALLLIISIIFVADFSIKVYHLGSLSYGNNLTLMQAAKKIWGLDSKGKKKKGK